MGEGRPVEDDCYRAMDLDWSTSWWAALREPRRSHRRTALG